ncbi:SpaA isopeptide-forming pilin-related protein, partial [Listeria monocytogenes]
QTEEPDSKEPKKDEPIVLLEIKNHLVKGNAELTKTDVSNGKNLPNTGIRILDKDKKVVIEGKTDNQGQFTFEKLPKGVYYFQEFDAPSGYQLDETPIQFEIKEDGEIVKCTMTNQLTPTEKGNLPQTGETTSILGIALGSLLLVGIASYYFYAKKKQGNKTK